MREDLLRSVMSEKIQKSKGSSINGANKKQNPPPNSPDLTSFVLIWSTLPFVLTSFMSDP